MTHVLRISSPDEQVSRHSKGHIIHGKVLLSIVDNPLAGHSSVIGVMFNLWYTGNRIQACSRAGITGCYFEVPWKKGWIFKLCKEYCGMREICN